MVKINQQQKDLLARGLHLLENKIGQDLASPVADKLSRHFPLELTELQTSLQMLRVASTKPGEMQIDESAFPIIKLCLLELKKNIAEEQEAYSERTFHAEIQNSIGAMITPVEELLESDWLTKVEPTIIPPLSRYLTLREVYAVRPTLKLGIETQFDEKFGILQAPSKFLPMLSFQRQHAKLRGNHLAVAFLDIDNFKELNTKLTEFVVDKHVLPLVMESIEAHVYAHGEAFRFGGDEFVLLLPNMINHIGLLFLFDLQRKVSKLKIHDLETPLTLSIGLVTIDPDSYSTDREVLQKANTLMRAAKKRKDCVASKMELINISDKASDDSIKLLSRREVSMVVVDDESEQG